MSKKRRLNRIKDSFYYILGTLLITSFVYIISTGGWVKEDSSSSYKSNDHTTKVTSQVEKKDYKSVENSQINDEKLVLLEYENLYKNADNNNKIYDGENHNTDSTEQTEEKVEKEKEIESAKEESSGEWVTYTATAYTAFCDTGCNGITATGLDVSETIYTPKGNRVIAADPRVLPLDSLVKVRYGDTEFVARVADTGGAIKNMRVDILMKTKQQALNFGIRDVEIKILN